MKILIRMLAAAFMAYPGRALAQFPGWSYSDSLFILTTPEGADIPASASEKDFPILVRLSKKNFDFSKAKANGEDIRFASGSGAGLPYQIEAWDQAAGTASLWVKIPSIAGNSRQAVRMFWGKADAQSESNGAAVFNGANGYLSVLHLDDPGKDAVGALAPVNYGSTATEGVVGPGRHFAAGQGIKASDNLTGFPTGSAPHSSQAWVKAETGNSRILGWGNDQPQGKVVMDFASPPHVQVDTWFSGANVSGATTLPLSQWVQVAHTYRNGESRVYVNGRLDGISTTGVPLDIKSPAKLLIGGWQNAYSMAGDLDEVRISKVTRSADWIKMEYENQKPLQTMVGPLVPEGAVFSAPQTRMTVLEGRHLAIAAQAGGAQKLYWSLKEGVKETVIAVDCLNYDFPAGRVTADKDIVVQFKAIYATGSKSQDIAITIKEALPDPAFALAGPAEWNGRDPISLAPAIANLAELQAKGVDIMKYSWDIAGIAVIKEITPGKLTLKRALNNGKLTVTLGIDNGGDRITRSVDIQVKEPAADPWLARAPAADEKPENSQFFARDGKNICTVNYNGVLNLVSDSVFVRLYAGSQLQSREAKPLAVGGKYAFAIPLSPGLVEYKLEFGSKTGGTETVLGTAGNLVCGDAYIVEGQSNAEATQFGTDANPATSEWIRTYGSMGDNPGTGWHNAAHLGTGQVGYWGMEVARLLMNGYKVPICIINGAVGGTRIDQHQRNQADPTDAKTIYGRLLTRVRMAKLTHGIKAVMWHQGENDQGSEAPTGRMNWETYQAYFLDLSAAWKEDFPNIRNYYLFQIWPAACGGMSNGSESLLREMQRTLPRFYSRMGIMSTLGVRPGSSCHFSSAGYQEFARLLTPLLERDLYGKVFSVSITPPDIKRAYYTRPARDEIALEFDQPVLWKSSLASEFYLDGAKGKVVSGSISGNTLKLAVNPGSAAGKLTYLDSRSWSENNILMGANNIAALTFWNVPIYPDKDFIPVISARGAPTKRGEFTGTLKDGVVFLDFGGLSGIPLDIEIVDMRGKSVLKRKLASSESGVFRMEVPNLGRGLFILKVLRRERILFQGKVTSI